MSKNGIWGRVNRLLGVFINVIKLWSLFGAFNLNYMYLHTHTHYISKWLPGNVKHTKCDPLLDRHYVVCGVSVMRGSLEINSWSLSFLSNPHHWRLPFRFFSSSATETNVSCRQNYSRTIGLYLIYCHISKYCLSEVLLIYSFVYMSLDHISTLPIINKM